MLTYRACGVRSQEVVVLRVDCVCPRPWEMLKVVAEDKVVDTTCSTSWWWEPDDWTWNCWPWSCWETHDYIVVPPTSSSSSSSSSSSYDSHPMSNAMCLCVVWQVPQSRGKEGWLNVELLTVVLLGDSWLRRRTTYIIIIIIITIIITIIIIIW